MDVLKITEGECIRLYDSESNHKTGKEINGQLVATKVNFRVEDIYFDKKQVQCITSNVIFLK